MQLRWMQAAVKLEEEEEQGTGTYPTEVTCFCNGVCKHYYKEKEL